jgi:hypothetical protein
MQEVVIPAGQTTGTGTVTTSSLGAKTASFSVSATEDAFDGLTITSQSINVTSPTITALTLTDMFVGGSQEVTFTLSKPVAAGKIVTINIRAPGTPVITMNPVIISAGQTTGVGTIIADPNTFTGPRSIGFDIDNLSTTDTAYLSVSTSPSTQTIQIIE